MTEETARVDVDFRLVKVERCRRGAIVAVADVLVTVGDIDIMVAGWTVAKHRDEVTVRVPSYRHPATGKWSACIDIPPPLMEAIGYEIGIAAGFTPADEVADAA